MDTEKVMMLEASTYENLPKHSKVFNKDQLEYHLWIYLDPNESRNAYLYKVEEIGPNADNSKIFPDTFIRESTCWVRANTEYLNTKVGKHTFKLSLVDRFTDDDFSRYISYIIQDDSPEKPYVYMKKGEPAVTEVNSHCMPFIPHHS